MNGITLILHAPDALEEAEELGFELQTIGFEAVTLEKITKHSTKAEIHKACPELLLLMSAVIVLASPDFFDYPVLVEIALRSSVEKKFIPVVFGFEETLLPDWFRNPIRLISGVNDDPRQWNMLIGSLQRRTGNHFLYSSFFTPS